MGTCDKNSLERRAGGASSSTRAAVTDVQCPRHAPPPPPCLRQHVLYQPSSNSVSMRVAPGFTCSAGKLRVTLKMYIQGRIVCEGVRCVREGGRERYRVNQIEKRREKATAHIKDKGIYNAVKCCEGTQALKEARYWRTDIRGICEGNMSSKTHCIVRVSTVFHDL